MKRWASRHLLAEQSLFRTCAGLTNIGRHWKMFKRDLELEKNWQQLLLEIERMLGQKPKDLNGVLFLIGVQELGKGHQLFTKEQKQDLMHIAICKVLSYSGYYKLEGLDSEGWPHWEMQKKLP